MIILTGSDGFIGKHFKNSLESGQQLILPVDVDNAFNFLEQFKASKRTPPKRKTIPLTK